MRRTNDLNGYRASMRPQRIAAEYIYRWKLAHPEFALQ